MQLPKADIGGVFNMGGAAVANYVSILEAVSLIPTTNLASASVADGAAAAGPVPLSSVNERMWTWGNGGTGAARRRVLWSGRWVCSRATGYRCTRATRSR